jgi:hypothetical protein
LDGASGGVGRLAVADPDVPMIYPVNFTVDGDAVMFQTSAYGRRSGFRSAGGPHASDLRGFRVDVSGVVNRRSKIPSVPAEPSDHRRR